MSLFKRIKNIIKSNIRFETHDTNFENYQSTFESKEFEEKVETAFHNSESQNSVEKEYYANLELPYGSGFDEIKKSYKKLLKKYHPDKFYGNKKKLEIAQQVVKKLNIAYNYFEEKYNK